MLTNINYILGLIFKVSYRSLDKNLYVTKDDYIDWSERKSVNNILINRLVYRWISKNVFFKDALENHKNRSFVLDVIYELYHAHLRRRLTVFHISKNENYFVTLSFMYLYLDVIIKVFKVMLQNIRTRKSPHAVRNRNPKIIALGFPAHSFSFRKSDVCVKKKDNVFFSFGEYYRNKHLKEKRRFSLYSIDEYIRSSSEFKKNKKNKFHSIPASLDRYSSSRNINIFLFFKKNIKFMGRILWILIGRAENKHNRLLELMYYVFHARCLDYIKLISEVEKDLEAIYALSFSQNLGLLPYLKSTSSKLIYYSYSQNLCEPPINYLNSGREVNTHSNYRDVLADLSPDAWKVSGKCVGFTDVSEYVNLVKKYINYKFGYKIPFDDFIQQNEQPSMLGYEIIGAEEINFKYIVVFDTPPQSRANEFSGFMSGNLNLKFEVISEFLLEVIQVCSKQGLVVYLKPKYSMSNYSLKYSEFLYDLLGKYRSHFFIIDPYCNTKEMVQRAEGCVCMPYTSIKLLCESLNIPSKYYMPESYKAAYTRVSIDPNLICGKSELSKFISNLTMSDNFDV